MTRRGWVIIGPTSIIAEHFAHQAAHFGHILRLVGRDPVGLELIKNDIELRFQIPCSYLVIDMASEFSTERIFNTDAHEWDLLIAHSDFTENHALNPKAITKLIKTNILSTTLLIHTYLNLPQKHHHVIYLSSVAGCRGRSKNSLYGASKAAIDVYLQGLQQAATKNQRIIIARLGFIDTRQTYGLPGIFYAASPKACAKACWYELQKGKKGVMYYPFFWRYIMFVMSRIPYFIYKRL